MTVAVIDNVKYVCLLLAASTRVVLVTLVIRRKPARPRDSFYPGD